MATRRISRAVSLLTAAAVSISIIAILPGTGMADPDLSIEEVQQRVDALYEEAEAATERAHEAAVEVEEARERLARIEQQVAKEQKAFDQLSEVIADYAAQMYASGGIDPTMQMMFSAEPDEFLLQSQVLDQVTSSQDTQLRQVETARLALEQSQTLADQEIERLKELEARAAKEKAAADDKLAEAQALLDRLEKEERERLAALQAERAAEAEQASRDAMRTVSTPSAPTTSSSSGRGSVAVAYAQAQVGKPYVFGGSGPSVFDCSGLTSAAWAQAGVYLAHASSAQYSATARVDQSALQPGDLVFFYSDLHHVGIYAGGGTFIHAANPTDGVVAESLFSSYWQSVYMGAGRV